MLGDMAVGDHLFDIFQAADPAETSFTEFTGIGKDDGLL
jgi:hypothetical protein